MFIMIEGNYAEALKESFAASDIFEEIGDKNGMPVNCVNIGRSYIGAEKL